LVGSRKQAPTLVDLFREDFELMVGNKEIPGQYDIKGNINPA
jgi:hypothetical protein